MSAPADFVQADALVEVEQVDRHAASDLATELGWPCASVCNISLGNCDTHTIVQAFARHRAAAHRIAKEHYEAMIEAEREECIQAYAKAAGEVDNIHVDQFFRRHFVPAIRNRTSKQGGEQP